MKRILKNLMTFFLLIGIVSVEGNGQDKTRTLQKSGSMDNLSSIFANPPESAKPGVLWEWMGSNITKEGITKDLEALKKAGYIRTTMYSLSDICTPWPAQIGKMPHPEIVAWTEPWWELVRFAAQESKRLGMDFGMHNCPGYESSGGVWITPELSMQELCWSKTDLPGDSIISIKLARPQVDPRANIIYPIINPETGLVEKPVVEARKTFYKDIAVVALPSEGSVSKESVIDLTGKMDMQGQLTWKAPSGKWTIYRFGHTTMGNMIQPAQWKAAGLECDKMSQEAVSLHMDHVVGEVKKHLGDLIGSGFTHLLFDSYEAGNPTWTPNMQQEFLSRRGYDLLKYLPVFAGRMIGSPKDTAQFKSDFNVTVKDLYRDVYFKIVSGKLKEANLDFQCEPYGGPWNQDDVVPMVNRVMVEFWTSGKINNPFLDLTIASMRKSGQNIVTAEAFTGLPDSSRWSETPHWLKPIGDEAFCTGVNSLLVHSFVHQPFNDQIKPGVAMGQWGTHFYRTQTWWKQSYAMVKYWQRCQALLQWGKYVSDDFEVSNIEGNIDVRHILRQKGDTSVYFVANVSHKPGLAQCSFDVEGMQPELWDPVTGTTKVLSIFKEQMGKTLIDIYFDDARSYFIVFRNKPGNQKFAGKANFPAISEIQTINNDWDVSFDPTLGGPSKAVVFKTLHDWTADSDNGIKYYSGTATYRTLFNTEISEIVNKEIVLYLELGKVNCIAEVKLNNKDLGLVWTAPWRVKIPSGLLKETNNQLEIEVTNVWANRLIGDEQEPPDAEWLTGDYWKGWYLKEFPEWFLKNESRPSKGRYCFSTWNYFSKDSPLIPSGLLGPVKILKEDNR
jgi:hypothetical protein